jgi:phosphoglycolate phosphatase
MPKLVLFDIDGTILSAGLVFREALSESLHDVYGTAGDLATFDCSGKTDPQIVRELMRLAALADAAIDAGLREVLAKYEARLLERLNATHVTAKPGAVAIIGRLAATEDITLGLLTGNLEACARAKLEPLALNPYFRFGAYGSDHEDRACLPAVAVERAHACTGRRFSGKDVVIVGDAVNDVRCGRSLGVRAVAVASGRTSQETLAAEGPDVVLPSLADVDRSLAAILG